MSLNTSNRSLTVVPIQRAGYARLLKPQGGGTPIDAVLRAATAVKTKVNSQAEIFSIVNSQATISFWCINLYGQANFKR